MNGVIVLSVVLIVVVGSSAWVALMLALRREYLRDDSDGYLRGRRP